MEPADIQCALKKRKITQKELAKILNVSEMAVSKVINKQLVADRIMRTISEALDVDRLEVFPEYYSNPAKGRGRKARQS